ncbi:MAG TPA: GNAT family N-acetyltransferase, partial [Bacteroidia bacterium]|nr:GNAT family N-acetyltransferase [Bacteroidia bacterium]
MLADTPPALNVYRDATAADAAAIAGIYNYYVLETVITFEEEAVSADEMAARIAEVTGKFPWIVYTEAGRVLGYAYASAWKSRCAYRNSVETTVYLHADAIGKGVGYALYQQLLSRLRDQGIHTAIGGIALPNAASVGLHEKCG